MLIKYTFLSFFVIISSFFACNTAHNTQKTNNVKMTSVISHIDSIQYHVYTRGHQEMYTATPEKFDTSTPKGGEKTMDISEDEWIKLTQNLTEDWVKKIPEIVSPTMNYASDADLAANITIYMQGQAYKSQTFDKSTPPKEFTELITKLINISSK